MMRPHQAERETTGKHCEGLTPLCTDVHLHVVGHAICRPPTEHGPPARSCPLESPHSQWGAALMILTRLTALLFALYLIFGQRYIVSAGTGGRGVFSPLEIAFIGSSMLLWLKMRLSPRSTTLKGVALPTIGLLFALLVVLPVAGVAVGDYEMRSLYSLVVVLIPVSILVLAQGATLYAISMEKFAFAAILVHGFYGFGQQLSRLGILPGTVWEWAIQWDSQTQSAFSQNYVISSRSTGLFVNANDFGLWSVLAVIFGVAYLRRSARVMGILLGGWEWSGASLEPHGQR